MQTHSEIENIQPPPVQTFGVSTAERMDSLAVPVLEACRISGFSKSELYLRMKRGEITAKKAGRTTLVLVPSLRAAVESLPTATFRASKQQAA